MQAANLQLLLNNVVSVLSRPLLYNTLNKMNDDEFTTCPYNISHRVPRSRLQHHLIKCQKVNPELWICPFNATHRCQEHLKENHYRTCPNRPQDTPNPKAMTAQGGTVGAFTAPKPLLQKDYLPENDPECEYWD